MVDVTRQYRFNVGRGPFHEGEAALPASPPPRLPLRLIAYYLPQFHAIPENDEWWGKGFTEWTNVTKALPAYQGHLQPRLAADLGYYDLSRPEAIRRQANLAKRAGLYGFCIHNYWFSGRSILETPLRLILENRDIDLRFCLNWANESWTRRWDGSESSILLEQRYAEGDAARYAESIVPAVADPRYIRIDGRPLVMLYRPSAMPDPLGTVTALRATFVARGVGNPYVVMPQAFGDADPRPYGIDGAAGFPPHGGGWDLKNDRNGLKLFDAGFDGRAIAFADLARRMLDNAPRDYPFFPGVCPSWDNEARKPGRGFSFYGATPRAYGEWLAAAAQRAGEAASPDERIVFVNAWNEWAEGAYLEPDRHNGFACLAETRRVIDGLVEGEAARGGAERAAEPCQTYVARPAAYRHFVNRGRRLTSKLLSSASGRRT